MAHMTARYGKRPGLEGPYNFSGRWLYYDASEGSYYDHLTDLYVDEDEMAVLHGFLVQQLTA